MTNTTRRSDVMSFNGSPSTAIRSASMPGVSVPILSPRFSDSAASDVAEMTAAPVGWPAFLHPVNQLFDVMTIRGRHRTCTEDDLQPWYFQRAFEHLENDRNVMLHRRHLFFPVIADAEEPTPVIQIVLHNRSDMRIEINAPPGKLARRVIARKEAMLGP
jgi:hypothetical protein